MLAQFIMFAQHDSLATKGDSTDTQSSKNDRKQRRIRKATYLNFDLLVGQTKVQDYSVSPLKFKGLDLGLGVGYYNKGEKSEWSINTFGSHSFMSNEKSSSITQFVSGTLNLSYLRKSNKLTGKKLRTYLGLYSLSDINLRINGSYFNTSYVFDFISSIGISGKLNSGFNFKTNSFTWNHQGKNNDGKYVALDLQVNIPLLHLYNRPGYATVDNFPSTENPSTSQTSASTWGKVARLTSKLDLTWFMKNNNALRMSYFWDAYSINPGYNKLSVANGRLFLTLLFRLNKKTLE